MAMTTEPHSFFWLWGRLSWHVSAGAQEKYVQALTLIEGQTPKCFGVPCRSVGYY